MENLQSQRYKKLLLIALVILCTKVFGQEKFNESFLVKENVTIELDAAYTNVIFETWNKKKVSVIGKINGENISQNERERLEKEWELSASGNSSLIKIKSTSKGQNNHISMNIDIDTDISFIEPMIENIVEPIIENLAHSPLSDELTTDISHLNFDYEAYKKDQKGYMKKWEKKIEKTYEKNKGKKVEKEVIIKEGHLSKIEFLGFPKSPFPNDLNNFDFDDDEYKADKRGYLEKLNKKYKSNITTKEVDKWLEEVPKWEKEFEGKWEHFGDKFEASMEEWGENFGAKMEQWGKKVEIWAEKFAEDYEKNEHRNKHEIIRIERNDFNISKKKPRVLIVKVPEKAQLILKVKYGDLNVQEVKNKSNIDMKYTTFKAANISDKNCLIKAAYSTVVVDNWSLGSLELKYSKNNFIKNVDVINLVSSASDIVLGKLTGDAIISGSFGDLEVQEIDKKFKNLDVVLENTDTKLTLPRVNYNLYYNGNKSKINYPHSSNFSEIKNGSSLILKGTKGERKSTKSIHITAKYSDVLLQ